MFELLIPEKRMVIINHPELGQAFFSGSITKHIFLQNLRAFAPDLCSKNRKEESRFSRKDILDIAREMQRYPSDRWVGDIALFQDNAHKQIENAKIFFQSKFGLKIENDGFISRNLSQQQLGALHEWHELTRGTHGIDMPTEQLFYLKVYLAVSLWRQEENKKINYLLGKGIGVEIALYGNVLKRIKRPLRFSYRSHSDFELYGVDYDIGSDSKHIKGPYPIEFRKVFGSQEYYPLTKTKGLEGIPVTLLMNTAEIVDFGGVRIRIPELEILFLDKYMRPGSFHRPEGTDAEVLARQYVLNKNKVLHYFDRFVGRYAIARNEEDFKSALEEQLSGIKRIFHFVKGDVEESGNEPTKENILSEMNRRIQPLAESNSSWGGIRNAYWVPILPNQIDEDGNIIDKTLVIRIREKILIKRNKELERINEWRLGIDKLLSGI